MPKKPRNNEVTGKKAGSAAGGLLGSAMSTPRVRTVAASDLTQVPNRPKSKKKR
jgi:hypothetical protein